MANKYYSVIAQYDRYRGEEKVFTVRAGSRKAATDAVKKELGRQHHKDAQKAHRQSGDRGVVRNEGWAGASDMGAALTHSSPASAEATRYLQESGGELKELKGARATRESNHVASDARSEHDVAGGFDDVSGRNFDSEGELSGADEYNRDDHGRFAPGKRG